MSNGDADGDSKQNESFRERAEFNRINLIDNELNLLATDLENRAASVANKASFLAVSAGVLITATTTHLWSDTPWLGVLSLFSAVCALAMATIALKPSKQFGISGQRLADQYLDSSVSYIAIQRQLVRTKADALAAAEDDLVKQVRWIWFGYFSLLSSAFLLSIVYLLQFLGE